MHGSVGPALRGLLFLDEGRLGARAREVAALALSVGSCRAPLDLPQRLQDY